MPRKRKTAKEKREEAKKKRLNAIAEKLELKSSEIVKEDGLSEKEMKKNLEVISGEYYIKKETLDADSNIIKAEKSALQKELSYIKNPEIKETPEFLTNPDKAKERVAVMDKINFLLKYRFSLVTIADILECNDYDKLDEIIENKEKMYKLVESYSKEEGKKPIRLFSGLKRTVGEEYSRIYSEQEKRMKAAVNCISKGEYFGDKEDPELVLEDIVSKVIDHPNFNLACQIETEFMTHELDNAIKILSDIHSRSELQDLIDELTSLSLTIEERSYAYNVMDRLINNRSSERKIIGEDIKEENNER